MSAEDRIRDAFDDLERRADHDMASTPLPSAVSRTLSGDQGRLARPGLAVAGLAIVVAGGALAYGLGRGGDDGDQQVATETTTSVTDGADDAITGTTGDGDGDGDPTPGSDDPDTTDPSPAAGAGRYRVATDLVASDTTDPFLNVRTEPDAGADLLAKLPATYTGLQATGQTSEAADGGTWLEVELLHPVAVEAIESSTARPGLGWVNAAFVEAMADGLAVGTDEVPACAGGPGVSPTVGAFGVGHVYGIESAMVDDDCLRVVLTFGKGRAPFEWRGLPADTGPATGLPQLMVTMSGGHGVIVDLGEVESAWIDATDTSDGVYVARQYDGGLDLVLPAPARDAGITTMVDGGMAVIDFQLEGTAPPSGPGIALTRDPVAGRGAIDLTGLARPFEANLGVELVEANGQPVEAVFSGNLGLGTNRVAEYGVATNDWTEAWGRWALRVEGLQPGDYILRFEEWGELDTTTTFDVEFRIDEPGDEPALATRADQELAARLAWLGRSTEPVDDTDFLADEVLLLLGPTIDRTATGTELGHFDRWWLGIESDFEGFAGPFNPMVNLARPGLRVTAGPTPHCASPPRDWPSELDGLRQVNLEPIGIDSCVAWFGVHAFIDDDDRIAAVALDLYGP